MVLVLKVIVCKLCLSGSFTVLFHETVTAIDCSHQVLAVKTQYDI